MTDTLSLTRPDDWHLHLRDGSALAATVPPTASVFGRAVVMPNLVPPVTTVEDALAYRERIVAATPPGSGFEPLMTLYLTGSTSRDEIRRAADTPQIIACKLYPAGATTNSDAGVSDVTAIYPTLEAMETAGLPLLVHGESVDPSIDVFDRESHFIEHTLAPLCERFRDLPVVFEHITTREAVEFVEGARSGVAATLTPQHLLMNRNDLFAGGLRPHHYCLPVLKRRSHQAELQRAALSGNPRFFLGTDSAPHARGAKETACGCAGCFSSPAALELYAEFFAQHDSLDRLEPFASHFGADFYGLPKNADSITLSRTEWTVPDARAFVDGDEIVPYWAGRSLQWRIHS